VRKTGYNVLEIDEIDEISGVDNPAQVGARAVIFKRAFGAEERRESAQAGHALPDGSFPIENEQDLQNAIQAIGRASDRERAIAHIRSRAVALGRKDLIPESFGKSIEGEQGTRTMTDKTPAEQLEAVQKQLTALQAELNIAKAFGELSDAEKAYHKSLDERGRESFLKLSVQERAQRVRFSQDENPVVYTDLKGQTFRKNDDPRMIAMAKSADEDRAALLAEKSARQTAEFSKRAEVELKNYPGDSAAKVALLKVVDGIGDAATRDAVKAIVKAGNDSLEPAFRERGTSSGPAITDGAEAQLQKLAEDHAKAKGVDISKAYEAVLGTPEGRRLYAEACA
jgi:hypothetical protein